MIRLRLATARQVVESKTKLAVARWLNLFSLGDAVNAAKPLAILPDI
jgi:hypothetical protein